MLASPATAWRGDPAIFLSITGEEFDGAQQEGVGIERGGHSFFMKISVGAHGIHRA